MGGVCCKCVLVADTEVPAEICQGPLSCPLAKQRQPEPEAGLLPSPEQDYWAGSLQERSLLPARTCRHWTGSCLFLGRILTLASPTCKAWWAGKTSLEGGDRCFSFSSQSGFPILHASSNIRNVRHMTRLWFQHNLLDQVYFNIRIFPNCSAFDLSPWSQFPS